MRTLDRALANDLKECLDDRSVRSVRALERVERAYLLLMDYIEKAERSDARSSEFDALISRSTTATGEVH